MPKKINVLKPVWTSEGRIQAGPATVSDADFDAITAIDEATGQARIEKVKVARNVN